MPALIPIKPLGSTSDAERVVLPAALKLQCSNARLSASRHLHGFREVKQKNRRGSH
jgi:hypothetical protein